MSKRKIIVLSIVAFILALIAVLFSAVFCLRHQSVKFLGDYNLEISKEEIIKTANFKTGKSIFMLDKDIATQNIENKFPYIKVVQIKTVDVTSVEFVIKERVEVFFTESDGNYYILDEDLKILKISDVKPNNLVEIKYDFNLDKSTKVSEFIGSSQVKQNVYNFFVAMLTQVKVENSSGELAFIDKENLFKHVNSISFDSDYSLDEKFDRIIIDTNYADIDIAKPERDLNYKVNLCFVALKNLIDEGKAENRITIKLAIDKYGNELLTYREN